jgi:hypothetical protein
MDENVFYFSQTDFWIHKKVFDGLKNDREHVLFFVQVALDWVECVHQFEGDMS